MTVKNGLGEASLYSSWNGLKGRHGEPWLGSNDLDVAGARPQPKMDKRGFPLTVASPSQTDGTERYLTRNQRRMF